jgi:Domain of unknown function (DUF222)/HNH endonuclease
MGSDSRALIDGIDSGMATMASAMAKTFEAVAAFDEQGPWEAGGASSMTSWLAARYRLAKGTAREWVRVAHALRDLPAIAEAFAQGRLSWDQLRPLTRFADPDSDADLCRRAQGMSPADLWVEARRHERLSARMAADAHRRRYLAMWWDPERPLLYLNGMFAGEQGTAIEAVLSRRAEQIPSDPDASSPAEARFADALTDLLTGTGSEPVTVVVHADTEVLGGGEPRHGPSRSETESGQRLAAETVRRLACDGRIEWVVERDGRPVGIGRRGRAVSGPLDRALRHRDRTCRFPGCEGRRWLHAHHLVHWAHGGPTDLDNLVLLCGRHHRLLHEGGWSTRGRPGIDLRFHDPGGRALKTWQQEKLARAG